MWRWPRGVRRARDAATAHSWGNAGEVETGWSARVFGLASGPARSTVAHPCSARSPLARSVPRYAERAKRSSRTIPLVVGVPYRERESQLTAGGVGGLRIESAC